MTTWVMKSYLQILGAGTVDGGAYSSLLFFDSHRYLFNASEGVQRLSTEYQIRISKINAIFISSLDWNHIGGLPGLVCTLADVLHQQEEMHEEISIVGPPGLKRCISSMRNFINRIAFKVKIIEIDSELLDGKQIIFQDQMIQVRGLAHGTRPSNADNNAPNDNEINDRLDHMFENIKSLPSPSYSQHYSIAYVIEGPDIPGKFDADKARKLGIPHGPLNGILAQGRPLTLEDGRVIEPNQVIGPSSQSPVLIITDVHDEENKWFNNLFSSWNDRLSIALIYSHCNISNKDNRIIHIKPDNMELVFKSHFQWILELDNPMIHIPAFETKETSLLLASYEWIPEMKRIILDEFNDNQSFFNTLESVIPRNTSKDFNIKAICLGTGAAMPGKYRNVSSTLVSLEKEKIGILLDCGEATLGQLFRISYPIERIKMIFISHLHADHHLGVISLIDRVPGLTIVGPERYLEWLKEYYEILSLRPDYRFIKAEAIDKYPDFLSELVPIPVDHCPMAYGYRIGFAGKIIVYSGDTRPSERLIEIGCGADLLIHEATLSDNLYQEAIVRKHTTWGEAQWLAKKIQAKQVIWTHFSQRYAKELVDLEGGVSAIDMMKIPIL